MKDGEGRGFLQAVIFAGGLGTRMREETEYRPKPLVEIGGKPILWHIMMNLSVQGISEFVILTGYKGEMIRRYFLDLPAFSNDFSIRYDTGKLEYHRQILEGDWKVTVVDTGADTLTAGRLSAARDFIHSSPFLLTYGDGLADISLEALLNAHEMSSNPFTISVTGPASRFGVVEVSPSLQVSSFSEKPQSKERINMGFMILEQSIFEHLTADEPFESGPLVRLASQGLLGAYLHEGFFQPMDTIRDQTLLDQLWSTSAPWKIW